VLPVIKKGRFPALSNCLYERVYGRQDAGTLDAGILVEQFHLNDPVCGRPTNEISEPPRPRATAVVLKVGLSRMTSEPAAVVVAVTETPEA
jgi:hypothetical protein